MHLSSAGNGGTLVLALPAELDVAREVVSSRGNSLVVTRNTEGGHTSTRGTTIQGSRDDELNLAERTTRRHVGLAHVAELASTGAVNG